MSFKEDTNPPLKVLKNLCCTSCHGQFVIRDSASKGSKSPILLQCGHSVCESCLHQSLKNAKSIFCQECSHISSSAPSRSSDGFPLNIYALGSIIAFQNHKIEKDKRLALLTRSSGNFNYSLKKQLDPNSRSDSNKSVCEECSMAASWYCDNCKCNFCETCWSKVHASAKSLMKHCKSALCAAEGLRSGLKKCSKHETQHLEFFCTGCSTTICSHCVILQHQGEGHCPITLKEKNMEMLSKVKAAAEEAEVMKKRMKQTLEKIHLTQNAPDVGGDSPIADFENQIIRNFARIHGILQCEEERYLKKLHDAATEREECLKGLAKHLETQMQNVESLLSEYEFAVNKPQCSDLTELHRQLKEVQDWPCYLIFRKSKDANKAKITFDENLIDCIQKYCTLEVPSSDIFQLRSHADLPQDYAVEPLNDSSSFQNVKSGPTICPDSSTSDVDTLSNCSSRDLPKPDLEVPSSSKAPPPPKTFCERRNYSVRVTYIKNPGEFYVTLNSQRSRQLAIEKKAYQLGSSSCVVPRRLAKDEIYLVKYNVDKKWYRGRVVETSPRKAEGSEDVVIYYLDYGNTEVVPLSRLRAIPADMMEEPPLAVKCKLFDCVPKNEEWCVESTKTMQKILNNYTATMFVMKIHQDCLEVDLSVMYPEGQIGRDIVSVRDALLFLEFSSFVNGSKIPQNPTAVKYLHQYLPAVGETFDAVITHVNSPSDFYIQKTKQDPSYLFKLTTDLQNYYDENSHKGLIYNPSIGMPCAALYTGDQKWYRAKVVDVPGKKMVTVFYVDFGNKETLPWTWVRKLKESFVKRPPLAMNCALAGIYPTETEWNHQTRVYLEKCALVKDCCVEVHSRVKSRQKLKVFLYRRVNNKEICVNSLFVEMGYATKSSLNSSWMSKAREQEETTTEILSPRVEESKSNIALDEEQPASDTDNDSKQKGQTFKERKKNKLSAKKLRELHENEKKTLRILTPTENSENEVDEFNDIFKVKVNVLSAESPSSVYVTFPSLMEEFKIMQSKLNEYYRNSAPDPERQWEVGNLCAIYYPPKNCWYRASVVSLLPDGHVKVFLKDTAQLATEPASSLRELDPSFTKYSTCAIKCHLADIEPPGDQWPSVTSEHLLTELENYTEVYMTKKGQIENKSLPIELWVKKVVPGGALEPIAKEWLTLNKVLVSQGLAVPKKSKSWYAGVPSDDGCSDEAPEDKQPCEEPIESSALFSRWLPPQPLQRTRFIGVPTYVDHNAHMYIHDIEQDEEKLKAVCGALLKAYENSKASPEDMFWTPGQICIARYHVDNSWYRGLVVQTYESGRYDVLFVDYGNVETCQSSDLRKGIKMQEIPVIAHKFQFHGIEPVSEDGKWPISVIEILHSLVVEKKCQVNILEVPSDPSDAYTVTLKMMADDVDVATFLVDQGLAVITCPPGENPAASDPAKPRCAPDDATAPDDSYVSRYLPLTIPPDCNGFFLRVTALISDNEFFANIVDGDSLPAGLKTVLSEFESLQERLLQEGHSQAVVESPVQGEPCCCLYPENNTWCRGEIESFRRGENSVCVFYVDYGSKGLVDKDLLHECKSDWLNLPRMGVKFRLADVERCPAVSKSVYMKTLTDCLKEATFFAEILKEREVLEVRLLTEESGTLVYQDMIDQDLMKFIR